MLELVSIAARTSGRTLTQVEAVVWDSSSFDEEAVGLLSSRILKKVERESCLIASGVAGFISKVMSGQAVAKHLGCQDSPWLLVMRTRHSRPTRSWLHTLHVALVWGRRWGCIVV